MKAVNSAFVGSTQQLDGNEFVGCSFTKCQLVYGATGPVTLNGCQFTDCNWNFVGAAADTVAFLKGMYAMGGDDGAKALVEGFFDNIRGVKPHLNS